MKQFVKALHKDGPGFQLILDAFPNLREEKKKMRTFNELQARQLIQDKTFAQSVTPAEGNAWLSFVSVTKNSLGNTKADNHVHLINNMLEKFKKLNVHISVEIHFLFSHLDRFPENLGVVSDEQGERCPQDIKVIKQVN